MKYLKMADEFSKSTDDDFEKWLAWAAEEASWWDTISDDDAVTAKYVAHAIKHHDSLVTENEALRQQVEFLKGLIRNMQ